jgi:hypothetical protein
MSTPLNRNASPRHSPPDGATTLSLGVGASGSRYCQDGEIGQNGGVAVVEAPQWCESGYVPPLRRLTLCLERNHRRNRTAV